MGHHSSRAIRLPHNQPLELEGNRDPVTEGAFKHGGALRGGGVLGSRGLISGLPHVSNLIGGNAGGGKQRTSVTPLIMLDDVKGYEKTQT